MVDELVFSVDAALATPAAPISLAEAGLREREHLQEWILKNPSILGADVLIITSEFDSWASASGSERDRLDVLGLDRDGRLVVAELKRDRAPDTVAMQAIKYAAMASRFTADSLAEQYAAFIRRSGRNISEQEAAADLADHVQGDLDPDLLRQPRIALVATEFPPVLMATIVWLTEMGLDISVIRVQAYRAAHDIVVTASQTYPVPSIEEFTVSPARASTRRARSDDLPVVPWDQESLALLRQKGSATVLAAMDLCAAAPGEWVPLPEIRERAGRSRDEARADLAVLTMTVKRGFGRRNWPFDLKWGAGGESQAYYSMDAETAQCWLASSTT